MEQEVNYYDLLWPLYNKRTVALRVPCDLREEDVDIICDFLSVLKRSVHKTDETILEIYTHGYSSSYLGE